MAKRKRIRLQDIADEAGVSVTAVSLYINGKAKQHKISDETCQKLQRVIDKHNFVPNIHARAIRNNKTYLIGMIVPGNVNKSFWIDVIAGLEEVISRYKYHLVLSLSHFSQEDELESFRFMQSKGVDAYLFSPIIDKDVTQNAQFVRELSGEVPVVSLACPFEGIPGVYNDNAAGGVQAASCLFERGHRRVAYVGHVGESHDLRGRSFVQYYRDHGFQPGCFDSIDAFMSRVHDYSAVFCYSDYWVLDLYAKAAQAGLVIPDDLSVVGYDNMDFIQPLSPRPTTVHQHKKKLGREAGELLMRLLEGSPECLSGDIKLIPEIVPGLSVRSL